MTKHIMDINSRLSWEITYFSEKLNLKVGMYVLLHLGSSLEMILID